MSSDADMTGPVTSRVEVSADGAALEVTEPVGPDGKTGNRFASLPQFVEGFIATTWIRDTGAVHWCTFWWHHLEVQVRLEALWSGYEAARTSDSPTAMSEWLRLEADHHMTVLTAPGGPLSRCDYRRGMHSRQEPWPVEQPPAGLFRVEHPPTNTDTTEADTTEADTTEADTTEADTTEAGTDREEL